MIDPIADSLNRDFPDIREALARTYIETQICLLGATVLPIEEDGQSGLMLKAYDVNDNLSPLKISLVPLTAKSKTQRSWFGAIPWDFYVKIYVEEILELDEYIEDAELDECFFTTLSTHQKCGADLIAYLFNSLRDEYGLQITLAHRDSD